MINDFDTERKKMEGFSPPLEIPLINSNTREGEFYPIFHAGKIGCQGTGRVDKIDTPRF